MQVDIYCDESRLEFLESENNTNFCFTMQATEAKKPFLGLKHLVKAILWKNYNIILHNFTNSTFQASSQCSPREVF